MERVRPVGRIDYLSLSGKVCESCYYYSEAEFIKEVMQENDYIQMFLRLLFKRYFGIMLMTN